MDVYVVFAVGGGGMEAFAPWQKKGDSVFCVIAPFLG